MTKKEFFRQGWIHIKQRLPTVPEGMEAWHTFVLCYYSVDGHFSMWRVGDARTTAELMLSGKKFQDEISWDRLFNYWMPLVEPEGCISEADYYKEEKKNVNKKTRS